MGQQRALTIRELIAESKRGADDHKFYQRIHISRRFNTVYINNAKVGCSTIKRALALAEAPWIAETLTKHPSRVHARLYSPLLGLPHFMDGDFKRNSAPIFSFCFVRNPYTRAFSCYRDKMRGERPIKAEVLRLLGRPVSDLAAEVTFGDFIKAIVSSGDADMNVHWVPQAPWLMVDRLTYSAVGRMEAFDGDFARIKTKMGMPDEAANRKFHVNRSAAAPIEEALNDEIAELIYNRYRSDFDLLGYDPDPAKCHEPPSAAKVIAPDGFRPPAYLD